LKFRQCEAVVAQSSATSVMTAAVNRLGTVLRGANRDNGNELVTFAFDEASHLATSQERLLNLRRAIRLFPEHMPGSPYLFVVFTDTISRLSYFSPSAHRDLSFRVQTRFKLYPPFYLLDFVDVFDQHRDGSLTDVTLSSAASYAYMATLGRPLWAAPIRMTGEANFADKTLTVARHKLLAGVDPAHWLLHSAEWKITEVVAILSSRVALNIVPQTMLASELVAGHMAYCLHVNEQRDTLTIRYPSEPILSEAAASLMWRTDLAQLLPFIKTVLLDGAVTEGFLGEFTGQLLLTMAWDQACSDRAAAEGHQTPNFSRPLTVEQYLSALLPAEGFAQLAKWLAQSSPVIPGFQLKDALLRFNHIIAVKYTPNPSHLCQFLRRNAAALAKRNETGEDVIIPIFFGTDSDTLDDASRVSYIVVQFKNRIRDQEYPQSATSKLLPTYIGLVDYQLLPFVSVYINLKETGSRKGFNHDVAPRNKTRSSVSREDIDELELVGSSPTQRAAHWREMLKPNDAEQLARFFQVDIALHGVNASSFGFLSRHQASLINALHDLFAYERDLGLFVGDGQVFRAIKGIMPLVYE